GIPPRRGDPACRAAMDQVAVAPDPKITLAQRFAADGRVPLVDGEERTLFVEHARGKGTNQLSKQEIDDKYRGLAAPVLGDDTAEQLRARVDELESVSSVAEVVDLLVLP